MDKVSENDDT